MVAIDGLVYAGAAVDVAAPGDKAVVDIVEADVAEELLLQRPEADLEVSVGFLLHSDEL